MEEGGGVRTPPTVPVKYNAVRFETPQELKSDILMSTDSIVCGRRRGAYDSQCFPYVYFLEA